MVNISGISLKCIHSLKKVKSEIPPHDVNEVTVKVIKAVTLNIK